MGKFAVTNADGNVITDASHIANMNPLKYRGYYYDSETGLYYLQSRYYDAEVGRFINADLIVSGMQGLNGLNLFAYCGNNPINNLDPSGLFWKEIGNFFKKIGKKIANFAKSTFGAGSSKVASVTVKEQEISPVPYLVTVKKGIKETTTISTHGNSSKPISVYAVGDTVHPIKSSSAGLRINASNASVYLNFSVDDIGIYYETKTENSRNSYGLSINLSELKIGYNQENGVIKDDCETTDYFNASVTAFFVYEAVVLFYTGQPVPSGQPVSPGQPS